MQGNTEAEINKDIMRLIEVIEEGDIYRSMQAARELEEIGEPVVRPLMERFSTRDIENRWRLAMALSRLGSQAVDPLIETARNRDESIRNPAVWALGEIGDRKAVRPLIDLIQEEQSMCCRVLTAAALMELGDPAGMDEIQRQSEKHGEEFLPMVMEAFEGT